MNGGAASRDERTALGAPEDLQEGLTTKDAGDPLLVEGAALICYATGELAGDAQARGTALSRRAVLAIAQRHLSISPRSAAEAVPVLARARAASTEVAAEGGEVIRTAEATVEKAADATASARWDRRMASPAESRRPSVLPGGFITEVRNGLLVVREVFWLVGAPRKGADPKTAVGLPPWSGQVRDRTMALCGDKSWPSPES